jgi:hypothetical protein
MMRSRLLQDRRKDEDAHNLALVFFNALPYARHALR